MDFGNEVPTFFDMCINYIQPRLDNIKNLGRINDEILNILLEKSSPQQILSIESRIGREINAEELWRNHCFATSFVPSDYELEEDMTWRSLYQQLTEQYQEKKKKTSEALRKIYSSAENQRKSKQIKVLTESNGIIHHQQQQIRKSSSIPKTPSSSYSSPTTSSPIKRSNYSIPPRTTTTKSSSSSSSYSKPASNQPKLMAKLLKQASKKR